MKQDAKVLELDRMVQQWACRQRSYISGMPAECGHHHISRGHILTRWDLNNIVPLTFREHQLVHSGELFYDIRNPFRRQYLINQRNRRFKDFLLEKGWTLNDFLHNAKETLKTELARL